MTEFTLNICVKRHCALAVCEQKLLETLSVCHHRATVTIHSCVCVWLVYTHNRVTCLLTGNDRKPGAVITQRLIPGRCAGCTVCRRRLHIYTGQTAESGSSSLAGFENALAGFFRLVQGGLIQHSGLCVHTTENTQTRTRFMIHLQ